MTQEEAPSSSPHIPLSVWADWWLTVECACRRRADYPINLLMRERGRDASLHAVAARLRCKECRARPASVQLVNRPDRMGSGYGGGPPATILPLP
jgi:hypothetical protein